MSISFSVVAMATITLDPIRFREKCDFFICKKISDFKNLYIKGTASGIKLPLN